MSKKENEFVEAGMRNGRGPMTDAEVELASKMTVEQFEAFFRLAPGPWTWAYEGDGPRDTPGVTSLEPYVALDAAETHFPSERLLASNGVVVLEADHHYPILCSPEHGRVLACSREMLDELLAVEAHLNEYVGSMASFGMETAKSKKRLESVRTLIKKATQP